MKWIDKREVFFTQENDFGPENMNNNQKINKIINLHPICQHNKNKDSIDVCNQYISHYANEHRTYKSWYQIFLAVMEMSLFNAFVIWSQNYSSLAKKGYFDFLINVWQLIFDQKQAIPVEMPQISNRVSLKHSGSLEIKGDAKFVV